MQLEFKSFTGFSLGRVSLGVNYNVSSPYVQDKQGFFSCPQPFEEGPYVNGCLLNVFLSVLKARRSFLLKGKFEPLETQCLFHERVHP